MLNNTDERGRLKELTQEVVEQAFPETYENGLQEAWEGKCFSERLTTPAASGRVGLSDVTVDELITAAEELKKLNKKLEMDLHELKQTEGSLLPPFGGGSERLKFHRVFEREVTKGDLYHTEINRFISILLRVAEFIDPSAVRRNNSNDMKGMSDK